LQKPDQRLPRLVLADEIVDVRGENVTEADDDPDEDDAKESSEENLEEASTSDEMFGGDFED
jgi:hypothetical protein